MVISLDTTREPFWYKISLRKIMLKDCMPLIKGRYSQNINSKQLKNPHRKWTLRIITQESKRTFFNNV